MKKSTVLFMGILMGSIIISQSLISRSLEVMDQDPSSPEQTVSEVKVFPNPSDGKFQMSFEYHGKEKVHGRVYDITGKLKKDITDDMHTGETSVTAEVDLESPGPGIYFIRIEWGNSLLTKKIIIR